MPSGINPTLGCSPITGCQAKDYYLPGKGVWAPKKTVGQKAMIGAVGGAAAGAYLGDAMRNISYDGSRICHRAPSHWSRPG